LSAEPRPCTGSEERAALGALRAWRPPLCPGEPVLESCTAIDGYIAASGYACGSRIQAATTPEGGEAEETPGWASLVALAMLPPPFTGASVEGAPRPASLERSWRGPTGFSTVWLTSRGSPALLRARRVAADSPLEPVVLGYLNASGYRWAPRLYGYTLLGDELYSTYREWLPGTPLAALRGPELSAALELLGSALRGLHEALAGCGDPLCSPEPGEPGDAERWMYRLEYRVSILERLAELGARVPEAALEALERLAGEVAPLAEAAAGFDKQRVHGDPHLHNALLHAGGVYIVDYSGEPFREPAGPLEKEPRQRDLAVVLRSLHYLHELGVPSAYPGLASAFLAAYGGCGGRLGAEATAFWMVERASYEAVYEALTSSGLEGVPAAALEAMASGADPLYTRLAGGHCPGGR